MIAEADICWTHDATTGSYMIGEYRIVRCGKKLYDVYKTVDGKEVLLAWNLDLVDGAMAYVRWCRAYEAQA